MKPSTSTRPSLQKVVFEFYAPLASAVKVAGDFNEWNPDAMALKKGKDGMWKGSLSLSSGRYEYRFLVDGDWQNDQKPVECVPNPYGAWNCVLHI